MTFHILPNLVCALIESPTIRKSRGVHRMQEYSESQILGHSKRCMTVLVSLVDVMPQHCNNRNFVLVILGIYIARKQQGEFW